MSHKDIRILRMTHLRGPSIWTYVPVIEALVDIGELEDFPSNTLPGLNERLSAWLPGLIEHRCSPGVRGGFLQRLETGTWPGHILEHVALELQTLAGAPDGYGRARDAGPRGVYKVIVSMPHEEVGRQSLLMARELVMAAIEDRPYDVAAAVEELTDLVDSRCVGPSTRAIVKAANDRKIPHIRLNSGNLVQLGYGAAQRRIWTAETDRTSAIAEGISKDKDLTKRLLATCGIPVPEGQVVESPQQAWEAAQEIGVPVCVKPGDGNRARGVSLDLREQADIEAAYAIALDQGSEVIVEQFIQGLEHRLLVVGERLVAASRGETASVTGDGRSTVRELVNQQINSDPRRGSDGSLPLETVRLRQGSPEVLELKRQGLSPDSVPEAGRSVLVKRTGNMTTDITDIVHPDVAAQAILAAKIVGLDIAGVDVVTPDITQPLAKVGGVVVEVNAGPSLLMHLNPAEGEPRDVGRAIADHLFPGSDNGRIPVVGFMGDGDTTRSAKLAACRTSRAGRPDCPARTACFSTSAACKAMGAWTLTAQSVCWSTAPWKRPCSRPTRAICWPRACLMTVARSAWSPACPAPAACRTCMQARTTACPATSARRSIWCCPRARRCSMPKTIWWPIWRSTATVACFFMPAAKTMPASPHTARRVSGWPSGAKAN